MTLYDTDFVAWTRQQATLLRSMPDTTGIDIEHLTEEIEGLGRTAVADLRAAIDDVLKGIIKRSVDPSSISVEIILSDQSDVIFLADAGVWRHVDLDHAWLLAKRSADVVLPERCPWSIERLISEDFEVEESVTALKL